MYLRSTPRRNKDGSEVRYLQLAHNVWDPAAKRSKVQVVYNFGRKSPRPGRRWSGWSRRSPGTWSPGRARRSPRRSWSSPSPVRAKMITRLEEAIRDSDQLSRDKRQGIDGQVHGLLAATGPALR